MKSSKKNTTFNRSLDYIAALPQGKNDCEMLTAFLNNQKKKAGMQIPALFIAFVVLKY